MSLVIITGILSAIFIGIAYIVTEKNAKYLLSGYNILSVEQQNQVDLKGFLLLFRKFSLFLGLSLFILVIGVSEISKNAGGILLVVYPVCAYIYFSWRSAKFFQFSRSQKRWRVVIFTGVLIFVTTLFYLGFRANKIECTADRISFSGIYSESVNRSDIENITLAYLPKIKWKTNGFSLGEIKKGYFKTEEEEVVKLLLNNDHTPLILIKKKNGEKIFYSDAKDDNQKVFNDLKNIFGGEEDFFESEVIK